MVIILFGWFAFFRIHLSIDKNTVEFLRSRIIFAKMVAAIKINNMLTIRKTALLRTLLVRGMNFISCIIIT